ncbi:HMA2 domain-containing protein [Shewanella psychromarinicola]|uniref:Uncharacterized protein n=1 Tax=Shewanella psychromarinicola TaxID=2487742 RepID=A0A3N4EJ66_9GAMM|nr:hypothetical protein [Shewanella psychromarinicola]AZG36436.1 hypothetical protein EGC80_17270 [Shewanella psychromarinicola]MCL1084262.1 hypothetical protein [Shewanella psychromarinicola]RPA34280.1 hypothetical protein EGC77_00890 [Shewanella psychromarinicola]
MNTYIHKTSQRLRIRSDYIRHNQKSVMALIKQLQEIDAVTNIKHKYHAGSVAIYFDRKELDCDSLLEILETHEWTKSDEKPSFIENAVINGTKTLTRGLATMVLKRLVGPSVSRMMISF